MWFPIIKKQIKKQKARAGKLLQSAFDDADVPVPAPVAAPPRPKRKRPEPKFTAPTAPAPVPVLPEEGAHSVEMPPMAPIAEAPRATGGRRELRRALVVGEILRPKF